MYEGPLVKDYCKRHLPEVFLTFWVYFSNGVVFHLLDNKNKMYLQLQK